ncbi:MAG: ribonuclease H-like YkuK family protein [Firmicutes bacterium]|nr:ribonuclease H-like YkuK family protein [Bacillota bacterium]
MFFFSPTKGRLTFEKMFQDILDYIAEDVGASYKLIVGTDSQTRDEVCFVTAVVIHRVGKGARYFYAKKYDRKMASLRQKIFYETSLSLSLASRLAEKIATHGPARMGVEIHLDVGTEGPTKEMIREIVGMVVGSGFDAKIKPESFGASTVADKHSK